LLLQPTEVSRTLAGLPALFSYTHRPVRSGAHGPAGSRVGNQIPQNSSVWVSLKMGSRPPTTRNGPRRPRGLGDAAAHPPGGGGGPPGRPRAAHPIPQVAYPTPRAAYPTPRPPNAAAPGGLPDTSPRTPAPNPPTLYPSRLTLYPPPRTAPLPAGLPYTVGGASRNSPPPPGWLPSASVSHPLGAKPDSKGGPILLHLSYHHKSKAHEAHKVHGQETLPSLIIPIPAALPRQNLPYTLLRGPPPPSGPRP
jgi:hypothetical protein